MMPPKTTYVYIDNFNMYYGVLKKMPKHKWLNLDAWLKTQLPIARYDIQKIKLFTANITAPAHDLQRPVRQAMYFRALNTIPTLEIIKGKYKPKTLNIQVTKTVKIQASTFEEKGTDVNLAVHLVNDAHLNKFDVAVVVSNDSDLAEAVAITARDLHKEVWVINPCLGTPATKLLNKYATHRRDVREASIQASQFSPTLTDTVGTFTKPVGW